MDERTTFVKPGIWIEYGVEPWGKRIQLLVTDSTAQIISNTVAVALTLALPRLLILLKLALPHILIFSSRCWRFLLRSFFRRPNYFRSHDVLRVDHEEYALGDMEHLLPPQIAYTPGQKSRILSGFHRTIQESTSFEDAAVRLATHHLPMSQIEVGNTRTGILQRVHGLFKTFQDDTVGFALMSILILVMYACFIGNQIIAISSARILGGSMGLLQSPTCGWYWPSTAANLYDLATDRDYVLMWTDALSRAETYSQRCYLQNINVNQCNLFYTSAIKFDESENATCPFSEEDVCIGGKHSAYSANTDFTDINLLGINVAEPLQFRRSTVCSPVAVDNRFIRYWKDESNFTMVDYYYGNWHSPYFEDWKTFTQDISPMVSDFGLAGYTIKLLSQPAALPDAYFGTEAQFVRPELQPLDLARVTLAFIRPAQISYFSPSRDPIFPATEQWRDLYFNELTHATVLGCVDKKEIKDPKTGTIWDFDEGWLYDRGQNKSWEILSMEMNRTSFPHFSPKKLAVLNLLALSMIHSDFYKTLMLRFGKNLDASNRIVMGYSHPLHPKQWIVEARKAFTISLARMQGDLRDMALGVGEESKDSVNMVEGWDDMCSFIKVQTIGWKNVNLSGLIAILFFVLALWILTVKAGDRIVLVWLFMAILPDVINLIWRLVKLLKEKVVISLSYCVRAIGWFRTRRNSDAGAPNNSCSSRPDNGR